MRVIRAQSATAPTSPVLFELPDVLRVLEEVAFWDVYYEHCSYFTPARSPACSAPPASR
jgi:hypothetical protein